VGCFANTIVLRSTVSAQLSFTEFLSQVRQTLLDGIAHQDYPFALLVERLQPERDPSYPPICQTSFTFLQRRAQLRRRQKPSVSGEITKLSGG